MDEMKKYFDMVLFFVFHLLKVNGQTNVYQSYPTDSAMWYYAYQTQTSGPIYTVIQWLGDTVINSKTYKQKFTSSSSNPNLANANLQYAGGIRQDILNEKIYSIDLSGVETDISVSRYSIVGDTFTTYSCPWRPLTIINIDSVQIGTKFHKRYYSQDSLGIGTESYILGVGEEGYGWPEGGNNLMCYTVNNNVLMGNPMSPYCPQLVYANDIVQIKNEIKISPNPFFTQTTLWTNNSFHNATLTVDNCFGQTVKQIKNISGQTVTLFRDNLPSGLYFLHLTEDNKIFLVDKLIIMK